MWPRLEKLALVALLCLGLWLRWDKLEDRFYFYQDEAHLAINSRQMILHQPLKLIGNQVPPLGIYRTPYFFYVAGGWLWLFQLSPIGYGVAGGLTGMVTIGLGWLMFKDLWGKRVAWIATILMSFSANQIIFDQRFYEPRLNPLASLVIFYLLVKLIQSGGKNYWYGLMSAMSLFLFNEPSLFPLLILIGLGLLIYKVPLTRKQIGWGILIFLIWAIPIWIVELRHNFVNIRGLTAYWQANRLTDQVQSPGPVEVLRGILAAGVREFIPLPNSDIAQLNSYCPAYVSRNANYLSEVILGLWVVGIILPLWFWAKFSKAERKILKLAYGMIILVVAGVFWHGFGMGEELNVDHLSSLLPIYLMLIGLVLGRLAPRWLTVAGIGLFLAFNLPATVKLYNSYGLKLKQTAVDWAVESLQGRPFELQSYGECFAFNGYYYLFFSRRAYPVKSYMDAHWRWMATADELPTQDAQVRVVFFNHEPVSSLTTSEDKALLVNLRDKAKVSRRFGLIEVLLLPVD